MQANSLFGVWSGGDPLVYSAIRDCKAEGLNQMFKKQIKAIFTANLALS